MRLINRLLAMLLAASMIAVGVIAGIEIVLHLLDRNALLIDRSAWDGWLRDLEWNDDVVLATSVGLVLVGSGLMVFELWRRKPAIYELVAAPSGASPAGSANDDIRAVVTRTSLEDHLARLVEQESEVGETSITAKKRTIVAAVEVPPAGDRALTKSRVRGALDAALADLSLDRHLRIKVKTEPAKERVA